MAGQLNLPSGLDIVKAKSTKATEAMWAWMRDITSQATTGSGGTVTHTGTLTANHLILGNGGADIKALGSLGTTTTVLHGNAGGAPSFAAVDLAADVTNRLPLANLAQGSALSVLGVTGNATADEASIVAASDFQVLRRSGTSVAFGAVNLASSNAVTGTLPATNGGSIFFKGTPVVVTNAPIKALPTTTIQLVTAQGAGTHLWPLFVDIVSDFTAGAYTNINAQSYLYVTLENSETGYTNFIANDNTLVLGSPGYADLTFFLSARISNVGLVPYTYAQPLNGWGNLPSINNFTANSINKPLTLFVSNSGSGDFTGGNAANSMTVTPYYVVLG